MKKVISVIVVLVCFYGLVFSAPAQRIKELLNPRQIRAYKAAELKGIAHLAAVLHDIDPGIFTAQIRQESNFNQYARSKAGAVGVAQIMTSTAKGWHVDPHDPLQSLDAAATHMKGYLSTYKNQGHDEHTAYRMALAAYNAGPGAVSKYGDVPPYPETKSYVQRILYQRLGR